MKEVALSSSKLYESTLHSLDMDSTEISQRIIGWMKSGSSLCKPTDLIEALFTEESIHMQTRLALCQDVLTTATQRLSEIDHLCSTITHLEEAIAFAQEERLTNEREQLNTAKYDLVVQVNSMSEVLSKGWSVTRTSVPDVNSTSPVVAIVGPYHSGKTTLLNRISEANLPCGLSRPTAGLSFKLGHIDSDTPATFLDTAGFSRPVRLNSTWSPGEQGVTEMFLLDLAKSLSDYLVFVVNDWTTSDQVHLHSIESDFARSSPRLFPEIIVIHNLKEVRSLDEFRFAWSHYISTINGQIHSTEVAATNPKTGKITNKAVKWVKTKGCRHVCLVNEYCSFGQSTNLWAFSLVKCWLKTIVVQRRQVKPVFEQVLAVLERKLEGYYRKKVSLEVRKVGNEEEILVAQVSKPTSSLATHIITSGQSPYLNPDTFIPAIDIVKSDTFRVFIDLPGFSSSDISLSRENTVTTVQGHIAKSRPKGDFRRKERRCGDFVVSIVVPQEYEKRWRSVELQDGVLRLVYEKDLA